MTSTVSADEALVELATILRWTWHHETQKLLSELPGSGAHPAQTLVDFRAHDDSGLRAWIGDRSTRIVELQHKVGCLFSAR